MRPAAALKENPVVPEDGSCAHCHGPRAKTKRNESHSAGTRLPRAIWQGHLETDPFCATECARAWHGCPLVEEPVAA